MQAVDQGQHSPSDLDETTGSCSVQRSPALVVPSVNVTPVFHQELNHFCIFINAGLKEDTQTQHGVTTQQRRSLTHFTLVYSPRQNSRHFQNLLVSTKAPRTKNNDYCVYLEGLFTKWAAKSPQVLSKTVVSRPEWNSESVRQLLLRLSQAKISA